MGTLEEKLNYLAETKEQIRTAIAAKGVEVPEGTPFREYAQKVAAIAVSTEPTDPESPNGSV